MSKLYISHISPEAMALKAAVGANVKLFDAIVKASDIIVADLAEFKSHADKHMYHTLYLLYEVVTTGDVKFLRELIEVHGLSPYVHESRCAQMEKERRLYQEQTAQAEAKNERIVSIKDDAYWHMCVATPYYANSLLDYAQRQEQELQSKLNELAKNKRENTKCRKSAEKIIAGRNINEKKFLQYEKRMREAVCDAIDLVCIPNQSDVSKPRSVPLYKAEQERRRLVAHRVSLDTESLGLAEKLLKIRGCVKYLETLPAYQSEAA